MNRFWLIFLFLLAGKSSLASLEYNARLSDACHHIFRLNFVAGQALLDEEKKANPSNHLVLLYENYMDFLKVFLSEDESLYKAYKKNCSARYELLEDENENTPWYNSSLAELKLQESLLRIKFRDYVSAAFGVRTAYRLLEKNKKQYPGFLLNGKGLGLVHAAIGSVPPEYRWLPELAGMRGSVNAGLEELKVVKASASGLYAPYAEEALFYLSILQCSLGYPTPELQATAAQVKPFVPVSPLLRYAYVNLCIRAGSSAAALDLVSPEQPGRYPIHFMDYKKGLLLLYKLDPSAESYFRKFLASYKGQNFVKATWQKLAWIALLNNDSTAYRRYTHTAATSGTTFVDDDKQAEAEGKSADLPNLKLLRARLLYDGGYYERALAEFQNTSISDFPRYKDQLELTYRLARIYAALGQNDKAINLFRQTWRNGATTQWYFSANSALLLGNIYEESSRPDSAAWYYSRCLELRHHEYQNSIDQKAQTGLERLQKTK